jgi:chemotaxis family two-component system sensor kinase Cph1
MEANEATFVASSERFVDLLHNLEVHQEELRSQNEELRTVRIGLELALNKYSELFNNSPAGYFSIDQKGTVREANSNALRLLGYDRRHVTGKPLLVFLESNSRTALESHLREVFSGRQASVELGILRRGEEPLPVYLESVPFPERETGELFCLTAVLDISARRKSERELALKTQEIERSNGELQQFAYAVSHDLQEPLRMIGSYVQLLARRYEGRLDKDADEFIGFAVDGVQRMNRMIQDLLAYSRIGSRTATPQPVNTAETLKAALANLAAAIEETDAEIIYGDLPKLVADASQMISLFQNLIGNAIKYRKPDVRPRIIIDVKRQGGFWQFSVVDNGIGIDSAHFARLFQLFHRLHDHRDIPGSGVGLAVCKKIVERHGGRIWVESELGHGSFFNFALPVAG